MSGEAREWFDRAYALTGGFFPFGVVTNGTLEDLGDESIRKITGYRIDDYTLRKFRQECAALHTSMPSEDDFREEKGKVLETLLPELREKLHFIGTAVIFGRVMGDIDIALIDPNTANWELLFDAVDREMVQRYPIVDWNSMCELMSKNGEDFVGKLAYVRQLANKSKSLPPREIDYIRQTVETAGILWGNPVELEAMQLSVDGVLAKYS